MTATRDPFDPVLVVPAEAVVPTEADPVAAGALAVPVLFAETTDPAAGMPPVFTLISDPAPVPPVVVLHSNSSRTRISG